MAAAAAEQNLDLLGITEHGPGIPGTCDPIYFCNLAAVPRRLYGVEVFHGCEANVLDDGTLDVPQRYLDRLDYAIVGIHLLCYRVKALNNIKGNTIRAGAVIRVR